MSSRWTPTAALLLDLTNWVADGGTAAADNVLAHVVAYGPSPPNLDEVEEAVNTLVNAGLLSLGAEGFAVTVQGRGLLQSVRRLHKEPKRQARLQAELAGIPTGEPGAAWRLGDEEWLSVLRQHKLGKQNAIEARKEIVDGLLHALDRMDEINAVVRAAPDRRTAVSLLTRAPFPFTEAQAHHLLDMTVGQQTVEARASLEADRARLVGQIRALDND